MTGGLELDELGELFEDSPVDRAVVVSDELFSALGDDRDTTPGSADEPALAMYVMAHPTRLLRTVCLPLGSSNCRPPGHSDRSSHGIAHVTEGAPEPSLSASSVGRINDS